MNCNDDRAEIGFASDFWRACRTSGYGQVRTNALADSRSSEGASTFVNKAGECCEAVDRTFYDTINRKAQRRGEQ
jgi:hypothetical protein